MIRSHHHRHQKPRGLHRQILQLLFHPRRNPRPPPHRLLHHLRPRRGRILPDLQGLRRRKHRHLRISLTHDLRVL